MRDRRFVLFAVWLCLMLLAIQAQAATYWVSKSGNNSNACFDSSSEPNLATQSKLSIEAGLDCVSAGDTLIVGDGTYTERIRYDWPSGTAGNPITVRAQNNKQAIIDIDPNNGSVGEGNFYFFTGQYVILDGFVCCGGWDRALYFGHGANHMEFINGEVKDSSPGFNCIYGAGSGHAIRNNVIHDCSYTGASPPHMIYWTGDNAIIEGNELYNPSVAESGYCIQIQYTGAFDNTVRNNRMHDCAGIVISGYVGENEDPPDPQPPAARSNVIYNNLIYNTGNGIIVGYGGAYPSDNNLIYNNTIANVDQWGLEVQHGSSTGNEFRNNIVYNAAQGDFVVFGSPSYTASNNLCSSVGTDCEFGGDPLFTNAGSGDFTLQSGSPAIDQGTNLSGTFNVDFAGNTRPSVWDIGAYEFGAGGGSSPPPEGLVLRLPMNEGTGLPQDTSGYENHVTSLGTGNSWTTGRTGSGINFAGTAAAIVADSDVLDFTNKFTVMMWVKPTVSPTDFTSLLYKDDPTTNVAKYSIYASADTTYCGTAYLPFGGIGESGQHFHACGTTTLPVDTWTHLAVTYDATLGSDQVKLWVNGANVASTFGTATMDAETSSLLLGGSHFGEYFTGVIDDVKAWGAALTATQIIAEMNAGIVRNINLIVLQ